MQSPGKKNMAAEMAAKEDAKVQPLIIFYDSEAANGNVYRGDIIEIAAKCHPDVVKGSFQSLINTKQPLCAFGESCIKISLSSCVIKAQRIYTVSKFVTFLTSLAFFKEESLVLLRRFFPNAEETRKAITLSLTKMRMCFLIFIASTARQRVR